MSLKECSYLYQKNQILECIIIQYNNTQELLPIICSHIVNISIDFKKTLVIVIVKFNSNGHRWFFSIL